MTADDHAADNHRRPWPLEPDPERELRLDARSLRAVAHPVRLRILGLLRMEGPFTATALATRLGLNSGATSYHLRQLASGGLIADDRDRGTGRERWWRAVHRASFFRFESLAEEDKAAGAEYMRAIALVYADQMQRAADERQTLPPEWQDTTAFSDVVFFLTADEAMRLLDDIREALSRYRQFGDPSQPRPADTPPDAQPFHVQFQSFLRPGLDLTKSVPDEG